VKGGLGREERGLGGFRGTSSAGKGGAGGGRGGRKGWKGRGGLKLLVWEEVGDRVYRG